MKKNNLLVTILFVVISLVGATAIILGNNGEGKLKNVNTAIFTTPTIFPQRITEMSNDPHQNFALYDKGNLVGYLSSEKILNDLFQQAYEERYQESFPGAKVGLGADAYLLSQTSYYYYENIDDEIINYINDNELFAIEATKITFSNGTYCYVSDVAIFKEANEKYLLNYVSKEDYDLLRKRELPPELTEYGIRNVALSVMENANVTKGFSSPNAVMRDVEDVVLYLGYGESNSVKDYVVEKFDTITGVAVKNGISVGNLLTINPEKIKSIDQALSEGDVINVAEFDSPIHVVVKQESLEKELLMPNNPQIIVDENYPLDYREVVQEARPGFQNTKYLTTYVNGVEYDSEQLEVNIIESPVDTIIKVGAAFLDDAGGMFIWPATGRRKISCGWMCYNGHRGIDIQPNGSNSSNWPILAAADGTVILNYYQDGYGWHVRIKHLGGYTTTYAHMIRKAPVKVGDVVTRGQVIGNIGNTGRSYGAHLHFEIAVDGVRRNPCLWLGC